jgi:hypothetical protein
MQKTGTFLNPHVAYFLLPLAQMIRQLSVLCLGGIIMVRRLIVVLSCAFATAACNKQGGTQSSQVDFAKDSSKALPKSARCTQMGEVEKITVRETLLLKINSDNISGTYHFATGERSSINDTGFQHLTGRIISSETQDNVVSLKLEDGQLNVFFDDDFAPEKKLTELRVNLKEKKVSFLIESDARETVVGGCTFE